MRTKARHTTTNPCLLSLLFSPNTIAVGDVHLSRKAEIRLRWSHFLDGDGDWWRARSQTTISSQNCCDWSPQFYKTTRLPLNLFGNMVSFSTSLFRSFFFPSTFVLFSLFLSFFLFFFFLPCSAFSHLFILFYSFHLISFVSLPSIFLFSIQLSVLLSFTFHLSSACYRLSSWFLLAQLFSTFRKPF